MKIQEDAFLIFLETIEMKLNRYSTEKTMTNTFLFKAIDKEKQLCSSLTKKKNKQTRQALSRG